MIKSQLVGNTGGNTARIDKEGTLHTVIHPHPPKGNVLEALPFRQYFTDNGVSSGSNDMRANGSLTAPVEFYISADPDRDIHINSVSVEITDAGATLNQFGNIGALTNGVEFLWSTQGLGVETIHEGLKSNYEFIRLAGGQPAFGSGTTAFRANNVNGTFEGYIPYIDFSDIFGLPWGLKLRAGTNDRLVWRVRDNVSGVESFNVIAYGIRF